MASNVRIRRLVRLIDLLGSGRAYPAAELARLCSVSRRTMFRDLKILRDAGLPIVFDEERRGFLLDRPSYLRSLEFTVSEALALLVLCDRASFGKAAVPLQSPARSAALKILSAVAPQLRRYVEVTEKVGVRIGQVNPLKGAEKNYELFARSLRERRPARIRYGSLYEKKEIRTLLSPYRLLFHTRSWYVVGRSSLHRAVRTFNLSRVLEAELVDSRYEIPQRFSIDRYLGDAWRIIRDRNERHEVVVRFQPMVAKNVDEVRWHHTQRTTWNDDGTLDFTATVDGLREIVWWVLGYGKYATVLRPQKLRDDVRSHAEAMVALYPEA